MINHVNTYPSHGGITYLSHYRPSLKAENYDYTKFVVTTLTAAASNDKFVVTTLTAAASNDKFVVTTLTAAASNDKFGIMTTQSLLSVIVTDSNSL